jgi:AraC family cel operon transcriptional repressor
MVYASRQLEMSSQCILEIAIDCGLSNLSHFYTLFREEFGVTPRAYRMSHSKAAIPN